MVLLVLLMLTAGVSGYMPDRFMDEPHMKTRNLPQSSAVMCGLRQRNIDHRNALGTSRKYMGEMPSLDNNVNDVPHLNEPVSDVPDMDTHVNDVSNADRYVFDVPPLNTFVVDKLNLNTYMDDEAMIDKNTSDEPEADEHVSDDSDLDKIIGGRYATLGEAPWQAQIYGESTWGWKCGGSIISEFWILTAGHCLHPGDYTVTVGEYIRSRKDPEEQVLEGEKVIPHPRVRFPFNDIGLVKIKPKSNGRGIIFGKYVQPICLPISDSTPSVGTNMILTGFGNDQHHSSDIMKLANMPLIGQKGCPFITPPERFCAGKWYGPSESCSGDSGSPLVYKKEGIYIQYGLVSGGHGCRLPNIPPMFTNVSYYISWILETIKNNSISIDQQSIPVRPKSIP